MKKVIEVENLTKDYGDLRAVNEINFEVQEGEIFGFLGPNGAGKTTTIKMLCALLAPTSGSARIAGLDVAKNPMEIKKQIGLVFQTSSLDDRLTGRENLSFHSRLYNVERKLEKERIKELGERVGLSDRLDDRVKNYSGGMKRRLELIRGMIHHPHVLFLDEPTLGLDPQTRSYIWDYIQELKRKEDISIFLTTHYMDEVELANRAAIIDEGDIIALDSVEALKDQLGGDLIFLETEDNEKAYKELEKEFDIEIERVDSKLKLTVEKGEQLIPQLTRVLSSNIKSINLHEPTMDDVFLHLTGKEIRENAPEDNSMEKRMMH
ncbi:ATP-binding cassette domain-containing protein [Candidatus Bipolaricaulota bacterium]|nr:ATP-binding cassette domain-containing protein [Candidatus Bipolaricaulota bacterium]